MSRWHLYCSPNPGVPILGLHRVQALDPGGGEAEEDAEEAVCHHGAGLGVDWHLESSGHAGKYIARWWAPRGAAGENIFPHVELQIQ